MVDGSARQITSQRLDSWKEIAAFFDRDERTVRRWEKERNLPVYRVPGGERGGVFAYSDELQEWLKGRAKELNSNESGPILTVGQSAQVSTENAEIKSRTAVELAKNPAGLVPVLDLGPTPAPTRPSSGRSWGRVVAWLVPMMVAGGLIVIVQFSGRETRYQHVLAAPHPPNAEAQELYLKGEYHWTKRTPEDLNKAVDYFTQAIVKDPVYAQAYVGLADCYNLLREFSVMPPEEAYPRALAAAEKAVELDDTSPGAHNSLAFATFYWNWDPVTAEREYKRALELDPNFVQGHHWYATFLLATGRFPEALDQIEQARRLDPSSTTIQADKGLILNFSGRTSDAFALLKQLESADSSLATTHTYLANIYLERKDYANYFVQSKISARLRHDQAALAIANAAERGFSAGGLGAMHEAMLPVQKEMSDRGIGSAYDLAATCAWLGRKKDALRFLQAAYERRETGLLYLNRDPAFNSLHGDLNYKEITGRVQAKLSDSSPR
jgi:tetratricopeptide (TPR) repeat protein